MTQAEPQEPGRNEASPRGGERRSRSFWRIPIYCGAGFCALQTAVLVVRFGFAEHHQAPPHLLFSIVPLLSGLALFFLAGLLAGLLVQWFLRDTRGRWRIFIICAIAVATPFSIALSLVGGLLGPVGALLYCLAPFLLLVGLPTLVRWTWLRLASPVVSKSG